MTSRALFSGSTDATHARIRMAEWRNAKIAAPHNSEQLPRMPKKRSKLAAAAAAPSNADALFFVDKAPDSLAVARAAGGAGAGAGAGAAGGISKTAAARARITTQAALLGAGAQHAKSSSGGARAKRQPANEAAEVRRLRARLAREADAASSSRRGSKRKARSSGGGGSGGGRDLWAATSAPRAQQLARRQRRRVRVRHVPHAELPSARVRASAVPAVPLPLAAESVNPPRDAYYDTLVRPTAAGAGEREEIERESLSNGSLMVHVARNSKAFLQLVSLYR